jgi:hypothetical protein
MYNSLQFAALALLSLGQTYAAPGGVPVYGGSSSEAGGTTGCATQTKTVTVTKKGGNGGYGSTVTVTDTITSVSHPR